MRGGVTDAGQTTNKQTLKIELLSQWKLEAEFRKTNLALGAGHLVQGLPLIGLGGKVELPQRDLHLPDPVHLRDFVKHLQHYRLLGHVSQVHLWVDSTGFLSISGFSTHFEPEGLIE